MTKKPELSKDRMKSALLDLTWKKMKEWADPGSVECGRGYLDNVEEPRQYPDGSVVAKVHGSEDYHTRLHIDDDGKLQGDCTCPVGYRCKHTVALALVAIKKLKADEGMRRGATDDPLWKCAMSELAAWEPAEAVEIWLGYVHRNEREAGNSHYNQIGRAMQKLLPVMRSLGRLDEWRAEMSRLRESYCRRPNLMSILKDIEAVGNSIDLLED